MLFLAVPSLSWAGSIAVTVVDEDSDEPLMGAVVLATGGTLRRQRVVLTDEHGAAALDALGAGTYELAIIYGDATVQYFVTLSSVQSTARMRVRLSEQAVFFPRRPLVLVGRGSELAQELDEEATDHLPPPIGDALRGQGDLRISGFRIPQGAAPLPAHLLGEVTMKRSGYGARWGAAAGPITLLEPRWGNNRLHGHLDLRAGLDTLEGSSVVEAPIARDRAWFAVGAARWSSAEFAPSSRGDAVMARVDVAVTPNNQSQAIALITRRETDEEIIETGGIGARWSSSFRNHSTEVELGAASFETSHELDDESWDDSLHQAEARVIHRRKARGYHELTAGIDAALQRREHFERERAFESHQLAAYLQDAWVLRPNLGLDLGLRWAGERTEQLAGRTYRDRVLPRLGGWYDWTREGRGRVYGHWGRFRSPTSADGAEPIERSIAMLGVEYELMASVALGVAYEGRAVVGAPVSDGALLTLRARGNGFDLLALARAGQYDPLTGNRYTARVDGSWEFALGGIEDLWIGGSLRRGLGQRSTLTVGKRWKLQRLITLYLRAELATTDDQPSGRLVLGYHLWPGR